MLFGVRWCWGRRGKPAWGKGGMVRPCRGLRRVGAGAGIGARWERENGPGQAVPGS